MAAQPNELAPHLLLRRVDPATLPFDTTNHAEEISSIVGQPRALAAVKFGASIRRDGYNVYVMGPAGIGKNTVVRAVLDQQAPGEATPGDWCYVFNFDEPHKPRALGVPAGTAVKLREAMRQLVDELNHFIPAAFDSDTYRARVQKIDQELKDREEAQFLELQKDAEKKQISLFRTPTGYTFAPIRDGNVIDQDSFEKLPAGEQKRIEQDTAELQERLEAYIHGMSRTRRERRARVRQLNRELTMQAVEQLVAETRKPFADLRNVAEYLDAVQRDVIENGELFRRAEESAPQLLPGMPDRDTFLRRYSINVMVDHSEESGAPVIYENLPSHQNLVGRVEHISQLGTLMTDFTLIKPGALHAANGGYLILDAHRVLTQPYAWESLKRVLQSRTVRIESLGQLLGLLGTISLEPEPIPADVKVVLLGPRILYYLLAELDPEFGELFKVAADFDESVEWTDDSLSMYTRLLCTLCRKENLLPFDRGAIARLIEFSARNAGDNARLSTHLGEVTDLMREADFWARDAKATTVTREQVDRAADARNVRLRRVQENVFDNIRDGVILVDTAGEKVAQVNGLSVFELGGRAYGQPSRITATVRLGEAGIVNIEREVKLSGPIHSKGVMILGAWLASRFAQDVPLSLSATLVFEQSYAQVEGDSASMAELAALLSALAELPLRQSLAVTGSVNQLGQMQAIGAVNEKIEGFFDVCALRGLTGEQGVIIPAANARHLMLRQDVIDAVAAGKFHIYTAATADEALMLMSGREVGVREGNGAFPRDSFFRHVEERLLRFAQLRHQFGEKEKSKQTGRD
jgi:predicted ATP-dependent protease